MIFMLVKNFLLRDRNITRDSYIWNMFGSLLLSFQSVIMLVAITHMSGLEDAGVFTISFAIGNLFMNIGKYGMRYFQVSDVNEEFTFSEYRMSRVITVASMLLVSVLYIVFISSKNSYSGRKSLIVLWMCLFKAVDAIEDVLLGYYQHRGRLDVAARMVSIRMVMTLVYFIAAYYVCRDLLYTIVGTTVLTFVLFLVFTGFTYPFFREKHQEWKKENILLLLKKCFPLFAGAFLSLYIGNVPKYAIDAQLSDEIQACYGFIAMPVFVIGMLNNFIFMPSLYKLSVLWNENRIVTFIKNVLGYVFTIFVITLVCIIGAYCVGVPVLSFLYNTDLNPYKTELLIMLIGGGFLGLTGFLNTIITVIRFQGTLIVGYAIAAMVATMEANRIVSIWGIRGAAILYVAIMAMVSILFSIFLIYGITRKHVVKGK